MECVPTTYYCTEVITDPSGIITPPGPDETPSRQERAHQVRFWLVPATSCYWYIPSAAGRTRSRCLAA